MLDQALEKHCRAEAGYSGIQNVYMETPQKDDVQQSFIFAETFKVPMLFIAISCLNILIYQRNVQLSDVIFITVILVSSLYVLYSGHIISNEISWLYMLVVTKFSFTVPVFNILG